MIVGVDIETYSSIDLLKAGVRPYTEAPDFTILLIAYKVDNQPTKLIDLAAREGDEKPSSLLPEIKSDIPPGDMREFLHLLLDPAAVKTAYNAAFERTCLARYFKRPMPPEQWRCTMVQAATLGLPGTLAKVGAVLGLERQKMEEGKDLVRYFCSPARDGTRHYPQDAPEKWELFRRYNVRDVDVETTIREKLARWPRPQAELDAWALDQKINDRGVRLDKTLLEKALELDGIYSERLLGEARELTGLDNPRSDTQLKAWLAERGIVTNSLDKKSIPPLLETALDDTTRRVLRLRQEFGKTSVSKYGAMKRGLCGDGRVHNLLQFYGAGRTGRWCLTGDHEILTPSGWVRFDRWGGGEIACWAPQTEALSFQQATALCFDYAGEMVSITTQRCEQCSTPDHKMPYLEKNGSWGAAEIGALSQHRFTIPYTGKRHGANSSEPYQLRVLIMTQADGHYTNNGDLRYHFGKMRKMERCKYLLRKCQIPFLENEHADGSCAITIKNRYMPIWLKQFKDKVFGYWLLDESPDILFDELPQWDGYNCSPNSIQYTTVVKTNAEIIQAAAVLSGRSATLITKPRKAKNANWNDAYIVNIWNTPGHGQTVRIENVSRSIYHGKVYCAETKTGYFLVRRKGKVWITGNSGRKVQVQNLPQNKLRDLSTARQLVRDGDFDLLEMAYGPPPFVLSQLIRTTFIPSEGCRFIIADYSAIEARVLAWLAGEKWVLKEFYGDGLIYEATASMMFHVPKEDIKKGGSRADLRSKGKVATLACGYQGSVGALVQMGALESGIPEDELPGIVKMWRKANTNIVRFWYDVEDAAISAVQGNPTALDHGIRFECEADYLFITLPSGRRLAYYQPELQPEPKFDKMGLTYKGMGQNKQYIRQKTYGGKLVENITQATARDCLRDAMTALDAAGYRIVFHVHDEVIADMPTGTGSLAEMQEIMGRPLSWAPSLPLRAAGFEADFYMKD